MSALKSNGNARGTDIRSNGNGRKNSDEMRRSPLALPTNGSNGRIISGANVLTFEDADEYGPSFIEQYESTEIITGDREQFERIQEAVYNLLDAFNVNWSDPNYTDTPKRVAKAYLEYWASGYGRDAEDEITVFPNSSGAGDLVLVKDMRFYSLCSHHLAPFHGYGAIAYLPNEKLLGLSKLGRILELFARRFQLQERIGAQTADKIMELLQPQGVMVVLYDTEHMCMSSRGVQLHEANTTTISARGVFKDNADLRREVLSMLHS
jgi:GTP cyclohydrolase IA